MDRSEAARIEDWFNGLPEVWRPVAEEIRELVLGSSPRILEQWKYNTPFYSHHRWMCYLSLQEQGLVLGFVKGANMDDPKRILAHTEHRFIRHFLPSRDPEALPIGPLRELIQEAVAINEELHRSGSGPRKVRSK